MNAMTAMKQYQRVSVHSEVFEASPHRLIQMLMEGALERIAQARGCIQRERFAEKGELIGKAISIVGGLREPLDHEVGGELSQNLDSLYEYMVSRLLEANRGNDIAALDEVSSLLHEVKSAWDAIGQ